MAWWQWEDERKFREDVELALQTVKHKLACTQEANATLYAENQALLVALQDAKNKSDAMQSNNQAGVRLMREEFEATLKALEDTRRRLQAIEANHALSSQTLQHELAAQAEAHQVKQEQVVHRMEIETVNTITLLKKEVRFRLQVCCSFAPKCCHHWHTLKFPQSRF